MALEEKNKELKTRCILLEELVETMRNEYIKTFSGTKNLCGGRDISGSKNVYGSEQHSKYKDRPHDNIKSEDSDYEMEVNDDHNESKQQHEELIRLEELRKEEESLQKRNHQLRTRVELMEKRIRRFKWKVKETVTSMNEMAVKMGIDVEQRW